MGNEGLDLLSLLGGLSSDGFEGVNEGATSYFGYALLCRCFAADFGEGP